MKRTLTIAIAAALGATASTSSAVMLNPRGTGQVLIYPYYTVNHQQTLVSVVNTTEHGKALKIRFREAYDGRDVANFNVYLGPFDSWVGAVYDASEDGTGGASIATNDNSCTVGGFIGFGTPVPGLPRSSLAFSNANYSQGAYGTATGTDRGPLGLDRTREGFFEVIEMGEVADQASASRHTLEAITPVNGVPPGCEQVRDAWEAGGYWTNNSSIDLLPPGGGLYGAAGIVDVALGTLYAFDATAIDGFSGIVQHSAQGDSKPNLASAITDSADDLATAYVPLGTSMSRADYVASTAGIDAVSAVLMTDALYNEYDIELGLGAATDWVVTFPTKQFYVDPAFGDGLHWTPPFQTVFDGVSCVSASPRLFDREGYYPSTIVIGPPPGLTAGNYICYEAAVVTFNTDGGDASRALGSRTQDLSAIANAVASPAGHLELRFVDSDQQMRPAANGSAFNGLPAIGFAAINYINANVTPGVLSNYSAAYPHRSHASCTSTTNPQSACP